MKKEKGSNLNGSVKIPAPFKTDTEKIAWLGDKVRSALLTIEKAEETKQTAETSITLYEEAIKEITNKGERGR